MGPTPAGPVVATPMRSNIAMRADSNHVKKRALFTWPSASISLH
jgi:hypothetical protein